MVEVTCGNWSQPGELPGSSRTVVKVSLNPSYPRDFISLGRRVKQLLYKLKQWKIFKSEQYLYIPSFQSASQLEVLSKSVLGVCWAISP